MEGIFKFYKEKNGNERKWYVELPEWKGAKSELEMVARADEMLDIASSGKDEITLKISEEPFEGGDWLQLIRPAAPADGGGYYFLEDFEGIRVILGMWLCHVTLFVFEGRLPGNIYLKRVAT